MSEQYLSKEILERLAAVQGDPDPDGFLGLYGPPARAWSRVKQATCKVAQDLSYTAKLIAGVISGFDDLQYHVDSGWEYVEYTTRRQWDGATEITYEIADNPYYVCVAWNNGTHLPLPLVLGDGSEYPIQNVAIHVMHWLAFYVNACRSFERAFIVCAHYHYQYES